MMVHGKNRENNYHGLNKDRVINMTNYYQVWSVAASYALNS